MSKKIKILHVQITENYGGIESLLTNVYSNIDRSKFQFDFIATAKEPYQEKLKELGASIYLMPSIKKINLYVKCFKQVLDNDYDIVHFHKNSAANIIPILLAKFHFSHPKIIVHSHNTSPSLSGFIFNLLHGLNRKLLGYLADSKVACSVSAAHWMFGTKKNIRIIRNGIVLSKYAYSDSDRYSYRKKLKIGKGTFVVGNVARFSKQKNYSLLIDIFYEIQKKKHDSVLLLIGDGPLIETIKSKTKKLNIENKVIFLGRKNNVAPFLSAMDAFVMPSLYEGLPIAAVEAQASGVNVFVSNVITGEVYLTDNIFKFSLNSSPKEIATLILKPKIKNRKECLEKVRDAGYDLDNTVDDFATLYNALLNR